MVPGRTSSAPARCAAGIIALVAWAGLTIQLQASIGLTGNGAAALWAMLRYFTVITNLLVALLFTLVAGGKRVSVFPIGGATLAILLVGIVYATLLNGLVELSGGALLADFILHRVTPVLVPLWWIAFATKGGLGARDPWLFALYPLAYFGYALARGAADGRYPYPFMDVARIGWAEIGLNALIMAVGFLLAGFGLYRLDRRLARD